MSFLKHVAPHEVKAAWPRIEKGLLRILALCPDTWVPRDIYRRLKSFPALAHLFACEHGFFIVERCAETHSGDWYLNVWCLYFTPREGLKRKAEIIQQLDSLAKELHCERIYFTSPRHKWNAMIADEFVLHAYIFRREVL